MTVLTVVAAASLQQVKAVVVNHGSFVEEEDVAGVKQPTMFNGSDNDQQISREKLQKFAAILKDKAGVESDVKVCRLPLTQKLTRTLTLTLTLTLTPTVKLALILTLTITLTLT